MKQERKFVVAQVAQYMGQNLIYLLLLRKNREYLICILTSFTFCVYLTVVLLMAAVWEFICMGQVILHQCLPATRRCGLNKLRARAWSILYDLLTSWNGYANRPASRNS